MTSQPTLIENLMNTDGERETGLTPALPNHSFISEIMDDFYGRHYFIVKYYIGRIF